MGEYKDVFEMIEVLASEDATVVVGTTLDSAMKENLRVTMVVTGIEERTVSRKKYTVVPPAKKRVDRGYATQSADDVLDEEVLLVQRDRDELPIYDIDGESSTDIPTFLRRHAD